MKRQYSLSLLATVLALALSPAAQAQSSGPATREQVQMDTAAFLKIMRWDEITSMWVLKDGMLPPPGVLSREDVIAMRDKFLTMHMYDEALSTWVPLKTPRDMSKLTRDQVQMETVRFLMMHRYNEATNQWVSKMAAAR